MSGAADFRHRVRFDKQVYVDDPAGGTLSEWQEQFTRKAAIQMLRGGEEVMGQRLTGVQPALIRVIRDSETATIDSAWRAVEMLAGDVERPYALKSAADMEGENRVITMLCEAGAADA